MAEYIDTKEAATILGVSYQRVYNMIIGGQIPAEKIGRSWLIKKGDLKKVKTYGKPGRPRKAKNGVTS